jgi:hypothetical protein
MVMALRVGLLGGRLITFNSVLCYFTLIFFFPPFLALSYFLPFTDFLVAVFDLYAAWCGWVLGWIWQRKIRA